MDILSYNEISRMYRHFVQLNGTSEPLDVLLNNPGGFNSWLVQEGKMSLFEQLISSPNGAASVAASSTAMNAVIASSTARPIVWASSTALNAIQSAPSAVLDALQSHPRTSMMNGYPSALASTFISGKSMVFRVRNTTGSDTNSLRALAGGSGSGNDSFSTTTTWQTRVRAYSDIRHYNYANNYIFQAYIINMNP